MRYFFCILNSGLPDQAGLILSGDFRSDSSARIILLIGDPLTVTRIERYKDISDFYLKKTGNFCLLEASLGSDQVGKKRIFTSLQASYLGVGTDHFLRRAFAPCRRGRFLYSRLGETPNAQVSRITFLH
jgi:hypothetical protein